MQLVSCLPTKHERRTGYQTGNMGGLKMYKDQKIVLNSQEYTPCCGPSSSDWLICTNASCELQRHNWMGHRHYCLSGPKSAEDAINFFSACGKSIDMIEPPYWTLESGGAAGMRRREQTALCNSGANQQSSCGRGLQTEETERRK